MIKLRLIILLVVLMTAGCVSTSQPVSPDSLNDFRDTLVDLNVKSNQAITLEYEWTYRNFKERIKTRDEVDVGPLEINFCPGTGRFSYTWGDCGSAGGSTEVVFNAIAKSRVKLAAVNQVMIDYANFLIQFNSANEDTKAGLDAAATKIGAATQSITSRFGVELDEARLGAFVTMGASVTQQLLAKKQRQGMETVMSDFQPGVDEFAKLVSNAMKISAVGIRNEHRNESVIITQAISGESDGSKRLGLIEKLLKLNEQTIGQLDSLGALSGAYDSLPVAHEELIKALQQGRQASLAELVSHIEMVSEIVRTYQKTDTG